MPADVLRIVQFPHPGSERRPTPTQVGATLPWNVGDHGRKYLLAHGQYFDGIDWQLGEVTFWGEWEAQSTVIGTLPRRYDLPRAVQRPHWDPTGLTGRRQNTDPLVFGARMYYSNCKQLANRKLRSLAVGSVILFGSRVGGRFVLDTVLVVARRTPFRPVDGIEGPDYLRALIADPLATSRTHSGSTYQLYDGATRESPVRGRYCFVPCLPVDGEPVGFARPELDLGDLLNHNLAMGARAIDTSEAEAAAVWQRVVDQVLDAGLCLATRLDMPNGTATQPPEQEREAMRSIDQNHECASADEFVALLRGWLESTDDKTVGDGQGYKGRPWVWVTIGGVRCHLNADSSRPGVDAFLRSVARDGQRFSVIANRSGKVNRVVVGPGKQPIKKFYLYTQATLASPRDLH